MAKKRDHICGTTEARQEALVLLQNQFILEGYLDNFDAPVSLIDHCYELLRVTRHHHERGTTERSFHKRTSLWAYIAARDAVMSVMSFGKALALLSTERCPTLHRSVDQAMLQSACDTFTRQFEDASKLRHSVAHQAEHTRDIFELDRHRVDGQPLMRGVLTGSVYVTQYEGRELRLDISLETREQMSAMRDTVAIAFQRARIC